MNCNSIYRKSMATAILTVTSLLSSVSAVAQNTTGHITAIDATVNGLMVMTDGPLPSNCTGTPFNWLLIPAANSPMVALAMGVYLSNGLNGAAEVSFYTTGIGTGGFCIISQVQPAQ
jgi:hypothetical protein